MMEDGALRQRGLRGGIDGRQPTQGQQLCPPEQELTRLPGLKISSNTFGSGQGKEGARGRLAGLREED